jgi:outer membrane protein
MKTVSPKIKLKSPTQKIIHKDTFLEKAVKGFMSHNHEIISIQHNLAATMHDYNKERGKLLPQLDFVSGMRNQQDVREQADPGTKNTYFNYGLEASYVLFDGFVNINGVRAKDFEVRSRLYEGLGTISKKLLDFIKLILTIQDAALNVDIAKRDVERKDKMYKEAKNRVTVGAAGKQDEFQARATLDEAIGRQGDAEIDLKNTKDKFFEWTGVIYEDMPWLSIPEELLTNFDQLEATLHKTNTSILQAEAVMRMQEKNQIATNARLYSPRLELKFSAKNAISKPSDTSTEATDLTTDLQWKIPLWSGGSRKAEVLQASKLVAAAKHGFYSAAQQAKIDFQNTKGSFISAQDDHQLYASIVGNYQKSYEIALDKYQSGATNFTELREVASSLNRAEIMLVKKDKERRQTAWQLAQILGSLTPSKLCASLDKDFDPFSDYNKIKSRI